MLISHLTHQGDQVISIVRCSPICLLHPLTSQNVSKHALCIPVNVVASEFGTEALFGLLDEVLVIGAHVPTSLTELLRHIHVNSALLVVVGSFVRNVRVALSVSFLYSFLVFFILNEFFGPEAVPRLDRHALALFVDDLHGTVAVVSP